MQDLWMQIKSAYREQPRDVLTFGKRKYFYVYTEGDEVYLESGKNHENASVIKGRRVLDKANLEAIYAAYRAGCGAGEVTDITFHSTYWFGIFLDLGL